MRSAVFVSSAMLLAGFGAWFGTRLVLAYALRKSLLDLPNHRSSHSQPMPRGGGLSIVVVVLGAVVLQILIGSLDSSLGAALLGGGVVIASAGWLDDRRHVSAGWRILCHLLAAIWVVSWVGYPEEIWVGGWAFPLGRTAPIITVVGLVWVINLFNFMDGIDGLAASEAAMVTCFGGGLLLMTGSVGPGTTALIVSAAAMGFLKYNWPPAQIFMGDVGSGFLGFVLGVLALAGDLVGAVPILVWILLLGTFVFDATVTLLRRVGHERLQEAHRRHAYQRAVRSGWSHRTVTTFVLLVNMLLGAIAMIVMSIPRTAPIAFILIGGILGLIYLWIERRCPMWS